MPEISTNFEVGEIQALFRKAEVLRKNYQYDEAILCYDKILRINPNDRKALFGQGVCYFIHGQQEDAIRCFKLLHQLEPDNASPLLNMAQSLLMVDRLHEALECFDKVAALRPNDSDIWNSKGILLLELGRIEEGLECFKQAILLLPDIDDFNHAYLHDDHHQKALKCLEKLIQTPSISIQSFRGAENAKKHIENRRDLMMRCVESLYAAPSDLAM